MQYLDLILNVFEGEQDKVLYSMADTERFENLLKWLKKEGYDYKVKMRPGAVPYHKILIGRSDGGMWFLKPCYDAPDEYFYSIEIDTPTMYSKYFQNVLYRYEKSRHK